MARKASSTTKLPSKLYFIKTEYDLFGAYTKRPTTLLKNGGELLEFVLEECDNTFNFIYLKNTKNA